MSRGQRFKESLQDGRHVWLDGEEVDVTGHPAFRGTLDTLASLFDTLDQPGIRETVGFVSPKTGEYVHNAFLVPRSREDLVRRREAFALWAGQTHGVMSRLSEYARSLVTGWYVAREQYRQYDAHFPDKITRYYEEARDGDRFLTTAILDPQIDRSQDINQSNDPELFLRVIAEKEDGVVVRGAKMIATAAPYAHDVIVTPHQRLSSNDPALAHMFLVPLNLPGLQIVCRESFASPHKRKHPLSARYEEMDAVLLFDDVLIPWERVFLYGNAEAVWRVNTQQKANTLANHQTVVRLLAKLEFVAGIGMAIADTIGVHHYLNVQEKLGELLVQVESIRGLLVAAEAQAHEDEAGVVLPAEVPLQTARNLGLRYYPRALEILQLIGAGGLIQLPSTSVEDSGPLRPLLQRYFRGAKTAAEERVHLFQLAWDLVGSPLASRHELYERFYTGDPLRMYASQYVQYDKQPLEQRLQEFWTFLDQQRKAVKEDGTHEFGTTVSLALK